MDAIALGPAQRRWSIAAAITAVTVFGVSIGQAGPLMSLTLDARGVDATLNGINAGSAFIGVLLGPLLAPRGIRLLGLRTFLAGCFLVEMVVFPLLHLFDSLVVWSMLRMFGAIFGSAIFTASEAWITLLAGTASRGRVLGLYAATLSAGMALGPLLLPLTGIDDWPPFIVNVCVTALGLVPLLAVGGGAAGLGRGRAGNPLALFRRAPMLLFAVGLFGLYEQAMMALLPIWGVRIGLDRAAAAAALSAIFLGAIMLQWPVGVLSDRISRPAAFRLCGILGIIGAAMLAVLPLGMASRFVVLFAWGGAAAAIYPVALSMAGDRFSGAEMVAANAAMIVAYGLGSLIGPPLGGIAMDTFGPGGLPQLFVLLFALLFAASWFHEDRRPIQAVR
jgi:MFS family permease